MPRPGPRPYECVRRAWHSERHQPIRGSLIREIFRVVHEIHGSATKKNKEWQEKLPIVVLKAEEIMYSKANSEAEYLDLKTLYDRTNDAIDTIIRRDESTETGDLLQPCIEAALNLGCIPRRASRSQRNNSPRCYLSPNAREHASTAHSFFQKRQTTDPHSIPYYKDMAEVKNMNPVPNHASLKPQAFSSSINYTSGDAWCFPMEACPTPPDMYAVYPLCYGDMVQPQNSHSGVRKPHNLNFQVMEPSEMSILQKNAETEAIKANLEDLGDCCDLSLRLGPSPMRQRDRNFSFFCKGKG